jgi:hypothetical protein
MTPTPAPSIGHLGLDPPVATARRSAEPAGLTGRAVDSGQPLVLVPALSERRRAMNRKNLGLVAELRCECAIPACRESLPVAADDHRGRTDRFIVAPDHLNGDTPVRVADRFIVVSKRQRR